MERETASERIAELFRRSADRGEVVTRRRSFRLLVRSSTPTSESGATGVPGTFWLARASRLSGSG
jgi:hypothetical protein